MSGSEEAHDVGDLRDSFGRDLHYLRLSVTDRCNLHCLYCQPKGCMKAASPSPDPLTLAEIGRLLDAFAGLGFWKVRLTGGEPTLRRDLVQIVRRAVGTQGVRRVGLTTNGLRLRELAGELRDAGLASVNVSLDSLDSRRFTRITGSDRMDDVVAGVEAALAVGIPSVKVNVVLMRDIEDRDLDAFLAWTERGPVAVRFIELMETRGNRSLFERAHVSADRVRDKILHEGWKALPRDRQDGPATSYRRGGWPGTVGLISAYGHDFCASCNRLRVSATGQLRFCLYGEERIALRPLLQRDADQDALAALIRGSVRRKPASHHLNQRRCGITDSLSAIGG